MSVVSGIETMKFIEARNLTKIHLNISCSNKTTDASLHHQLERHYGHVPISDHIIRSFRHLHQTASVTPQSSYLPG